MPDPENNKTVNIIGSWYVDLNTNPLEDIRHGMNLARAEPLRHNFTPPRYHLIPEGEELPVVNPFIHSPERLDSIEEKLDMVLAHLGYKSDKIILVSEEMAGRMKLKL